MLHSFSLVYDRVDPHGIALQISINTTEYYIIFNFLMELWKTCFGDFLFGSKDDFKI
jgi:hypothetical protein